MNTEAPGLITGGRDHSPLAGSSHGNWLATQFRIVPLLNTGIEGVEIHMNDPPWRRTGPNYGVSWTIALGNVESFIQHRPPRPPTTTLQRYAVRRRLAQRENDRSYWM